MVKTKVQTQTVTNTQLGVAVLAAFLAGGLAFAAAPGKNLVRNTDQCAVASVAFGPSCGVQKYKSAQYTCSNGAKIELDKTCRSSSEIQKAAEQACGKLKCSAAPSFAVWKSVSPTNSAAGNPSVVTSTPDPVPSPVTSTPTSTPTPPPAPPRNTPGPDMQQFNAAPIALAACGTPAGGWQPYNTYTLTQDVQIPAGSVSCFSIADGVHDIILDCQNYAINGQGVANAIGISMQGRTDVNRLVQFNEIKNCRIQNVRDGINLTDVNYTIVRQNTVDSSVRNAFSFYGKNNVVENNTSINGKSAHIVVHNSIRTRVSGNTISNNNVWNGRIDDLDDGIRLSGDLSHDNTIEDNTISNVHGNGISVSGAVNGTAIRNNNVQHVNLRGLAITIPEGGSSLSVSNNLICGNGSGNYITDVECYNPVVLTGNGNTFTNIYGCGDGWPVQGVHYNQCQ